MVAGLPGCFGGLQEALVETLAGIKARQFDSRGMPVIFNSIRRWA